MLLFIPVVVVGTVVDLDLGSVVEGPQGPPSGPQKVVNSQGIITATSNLN